MIADLGELRMRDGNSGLDSPKLRRQLRGDLDNVVLKALSKEPARRYASAEQFAADIQRHREGRPVLAAPDSLLYRGKKFVRRNAWGVAAAILLLLAVLVGAFATLHQARIAAINEQRADKRFNDVRKLANSLLFEIHDSIEDLPGSVPARKLLVERALQYLDSLSQEANGDPSLQRELASAYLRIGDVQGYPFSANLGDPQGAAKSYHTALAINEALVRSDPKDVPDLLRQATLYRRLAETDSVNQNISGAQVEGQLAVKAGESAATRLPQDRDVLIGLVKDYQTLAGIQGGNTSANLGDAGGALVLHRKAADIAERLCSVGTPDTVLRRLLAGELIRLGDQLIMNGTWREAEKQYSRAVKILSELASPNDATMQVDFAESNSHAGAGEIDGGNFAAAKKSFGKSLEIYLGLAQTDPQNVNDRIGVMLGYTYLGDAEAKLGETRNAMTSLTAAHGIAEKFSSVTLTAEIRTFQAMLNIETGESLARSGDVDAALQQYGMARSIFEQLTKDDPGNVDNRLDLAAAYDKLGEGLLAKKNSVAAADAFRKALDLSQTIAVGSNAQLLYVVADSYTGLGDSMALQASDPVLSIKMQIERSKVAQAFYEKSLETWSKVPEPAIESPDGFDSVPPQIVNRSLERCRQSLRQLTVLHFGPNE
jgi:eukaryotic-like serine/threonine-protein kinase